MGLVPSYGLLVAVQAALVFVPGRPRRLASSRALGLVIPAAAMAVGVALASSTGGADFLTALAAVVTPILAAAAGWARGWPRPWLPALAVPGLYALAWLRPDSLDGQAAEVALICGACLAVTGVVAALAPQSWLVVGLVLLVVLDCVLVWGDRSVGPAMNTLQHSVPPSIGRPLPSLQQAVFGDATMGWLDFAAPALLGLLVCRAHPRRRRDGGRGLALGVPADRDVADRRDAAGSGRAARGLPQVGGRVHVAGSTEVAALDQLRRQVAQPLVRHRVPGGALDQHGMEPLTLVRRGDDRRAASCHAEITRSIAYG